MVSKGSNANVASKKASSHRATPKKGTTTPKKISLCKPTTTTKKRTSRIMKQINEDEWNDVVFFEARISSDDQPEDSSQYYT